MEITLDPTMARALWYFLIFAGFIGAIALMLLVVAVPMELAQRRKIPGWVGAIPLVLVLAGLVFLICYLLALPPPVNPVQP